MQVAIIGAGAMGTWFAEVTAGWLDPMFVDPDEDRAVAVANRFDAQSGTLEEHGSIDVVCTAVPLRKTERILKEYAPYAERAVIDLSGEMRTPLDAMRTAVPDCERLSLHALFAPDHAPGNIAVVGEETGVIYERLRERLASRDNRVFETTAEAHDRAMETVQAKVHAAVMAYAMTAKPIDERFHTPISAELSDLAARMLAGSPRVYADIQATFGGAEDLAEAANAIATADRDAFEELYRETAGTFDTRDNSPE